MINLRYNARLDPAIFRPEDPDFGQLSSQNC